MIQLDYDYDENELKQSPISITRLTPIQMPQININELKEGRSKLPKKSG